MKYGNIIDDHDIRGKDPEWVKNFLRNHNTGTNNLGRQYLGHILLSYNNPTVLDVACGTAVNHETWNLMQVKHQYIGLDSTQALLDEAGQRYCDDIQLVKGFAQDLPFQDNQFDIIVIRHLLEHLHEGYAKVIREGLRVAKKELIVVFFLDPSDQEADLIEERNSGIAEHPYITHHWNIYSWLKFTQFVAELGVQIKVNRVVTPGAAHADTIVRLIK